MTRRVPDIIHSIPALDRRALIRWAGALGVALGPGSRFGIAHAAIAAAADAQGYGKDPDLLDPKIPWPRLMTASELGAARILCDHVLPAEGSAPSASALHIDALIDEWISAPYPTQLADRALIRAGLAWLETLARKKRASGFASAPQAVRADALRELSDPASPQRPFYRRIRELIIGGYYTTEAGFKDIGYIGNQSLEAFPPPSAEVMAVLDKASARLGLPIDKV